MDPSLLGLLEPIGGVVPFEGNARSHDLPVIRESLRVNGQFRPLIVRASTGEVLAGNGTLAAALEEGWTHIAVQRLDVDEVAARRIVLVDNRASDLAGYDDVLLAALLAEFGDDLAGTGWDLGAVDELAARTAAAFTDPDETPPLAPAAREPVTVMGDVWLLGPHRLVCGDATDRVAVEAALDGQQIDLMLTDPPYGVSYTAGGSREQILNDELRGDPLFHMLDEAFGIAVFRMKPGAPFYVFAPPGPQQTEFRLALASAGLLLRQQLVWVKQSLVLGRSDYQPRHESVLAGDLEDPCEDELTESALYGWADGKHLWAGGRKQTTVWEFDRPSASTLHPTMKPVAMLEQAITNSSPPGGYVFDPFAGSGSTLIACLATGRRACLIELDPAYCDVIVRRFNEHTGQPAQRGASGVMVDLAGAW